MASTMTNPSPTSQPVEELHVYHIICEDGIRRELVAKDDALKWHNAELARETQAARMEATEQAFNEIFDFAPKEPFGKWTQTMIAQWFFGLKELLNERLAALRQPVAEKGK